jgi:Arc/MetJ-type ribon-helix-helix transcriptional regulator
MKSLWNLGVFGLAVAAFIASRALHERTAASVSAAIPVAATPAGDAERGERLRGRARIQARDLAGLEALALALANAGRFGPTSDLARETLNTVSESRTDNEARHRHLGDDIAAKYPQLTAAKREVLLAVNDRIETNRRRWRASFMLDSVPEDEYVAALRSEVRASFDELRDALTVDEFHRLVGWEPTADPFDPAGAWVDPAMPTGKDAIAEGTDMAPAR